jgi:hypothetical protein
MGVMLVIGGWDPAADTPQAGGELILPRIARIQVSVRFCTHAPAADLLLVSVTPFFL